LTRFPVATTTALLGLLDDLQASGMDPRRRERTDARRLDADGEPVEVTPVDIHAFGLALQLAQARSFEGAFLVGRSTLLPKVNRGRFLGSLRRLARVGIRRGDAKPVPLIEAEGRGEWRLHPEVWGQFAGPAAGGFGQLPEAALELSPRRFVRVLRVAVYLRQNYRERVLRVSPPDWPQRVGTSLDGKLADDCKAVGLATISDFGDVTASREIDAEYKPLVAARQRFNPKGQEHGTGRKNRSSSRDARRGRDRAERRATRHGGT
jgi:hypothetical protein